MSFRTITMLLAATFIGCAAQSNSEGDDQESLVASSDNSLSAYGEQLVGSYKGDALYPRFQLNADSTYNWDTGIRCITTPCPSGDSGNFSIWRDAFDRRYVRLLSNDWRVTRWFRVSSLKPVTLVGAFGTTGTYKKEVPVVTGPACAQVYSPDGKFYAKNFATMAEADVWAAGIAAGGAYGISAFTCEVTAASYACTEEYAPVCAMISGTDVGKTYSNACELRRATIAAAGAVSDAFAVSTKGECTTGTAKCSTYTVGSDTSWAYYVHNFNSQFEADAWIALNPQAISSKVLDGKCQDWTVCTKEYFPVCGGVRSETAHTYGNRCMFEASVRADSAATGWSKGYASQGACL
jgi:hypothetical protein